MPDSLLQEKLVSGEFVVTTEVGPPKGADTSEMVEQIDLLKSLVDAINVTDHQSSVMRYPSVGGCMLVKERGGEPVLQVTCRDRNRMAIQADLLLAYSRGIYNVLCLTGDAIDVGDHADAKPAFDLDSVQLLRAVGILESGTDMSGNELKGVPKFYAGATVSPEADFIEPQLIKFEKKVAAGAKFFQTQGVFDLSSLRKFRQYASQFDVKILAGVIVLASARMARYMNANVPGILVPEPIIEEMDGAKRGERLQKGIEIAARLIREMKEENLCHGVHIMAVGNEMRVPEIVEAAGLNGSQP